MPWTSVAGCELPDLIGKTPVGRDIPTLGCLGAVVLRVLDAVFFFLGAAAVIYLIFGSMRFLISGGDPKAVEAAKNTMTYAIIGLVIILLAFLFVNFIGTFLGLPAGQLLQLTIVQ